MATEDVSVVDSKMSKCAELLVPINEMLAKDVTKMTQDEYQLHAVTLDKAKAQVKEWYKRLLLSDEGDVTMSGLPFDSRMMERVHMDLRSERLKGYYSDPNLTIKDKSAITDKLIDETWEKMYEVVKHNQPNRTKKEYDDLIKVYHEVLDPRDRYLGKMNQTAKTLFLQAYWAGGDKGVKEVEQACQKLLMFWNTWPADYCEQWKQCLTMEPNLSMAGEIGLFIKATDPYFVLKILNFVRREQVSAQLTRCAHKVLLDVHQHDYQMQMEWRDKMSKKHAPLEDTKRELRGMMPDYSDKIDQIIYQQEVIQKEREDLTKILEQKKEYPVLSVEEMLKMAIHQALWVQENDSRQKDVDAFVADVTKYAMSGKGNIVDLEAKAKSLFPNTRVGDDRPCDDLEFRRTFVNFHRGVRQRMETWSFKDAMLATTDGKLEKIHHKREIVSQHIRGEFPDPIVRMVKHLIETNKCQELEQIVAHYGDIISRYKGEVYGTVTSATEMSDAELKTVVDTLQKQNPGKTYFLDKATDPNLLAGFVIACGGDKIDYSLAAQIGSLKKSVGQM